MSLWDPEKRAEAHTLIKWLLSHRTTDGGWPADGITDVAIREFGCSATPRLPASVVMRVLNEFHPHSMSHQIASKLLPLAVSNILPLFRV